jgi:uncharacterized protein (TIGR02646 family)
MHQLDRSHVPSPACLGRYRHGRDNWNDLSDADRQAIRAALEVMQGCRCAYCECSLDAHHSQHIEHFRQRGRYPQGTFDWHNLFWSCERDDSCGKHKDGGGLYNHDDLIKPDVEDPEQFFLFVSNGSIVLRAGLSAAQQHRAKETLRILNLDAQRGPLRHMRQRAARGYIRVVEDIMEMAAIHPPDVWQPHLERELDQSRSLPFCTAIKHVLTRQGVMP